MEHQHGRNIFYVRIPYIKPVIIANCLLVLNGSLRSFEFSYLLTHGGSGNASELMTTYMYKQAFSKYEIWLRKFCSDHDRNHLYGSWNVIS